MTGVALLFVSRPVVGVASYKSPGICAVFAQACPTEMVTVPVKCSVRWYSFAFLCFHCTLACVVCLMPYIFVCYYRVDQSLLCL